MTLLHSFWPRSKTEHWRVLIFTMLLVIVGWLFLRPQPDYGMKCQRLENQVQMYGALGPQDGKYYRENCELYVPSH